MSEDKKNILSNSVSGNALKELQKRIGTSNDLLKKHQDGYDKSDLELDASTSRATHMLEKRVSYFFNAVTSKGNGAHKNVSSNTVDSMLAVAGKDFENNSSKKSLAKKTSDSIEQSKKEILAMNKKFLSGMMETNKKNFQENLITYNLIMKIIPKMRLVMKTFTNTIISPDDFTKSSLNAIIAQENMSENTINEVRDRVYSLLEDYNLNDNLQNDITAYLRDGKIFYIVKSLNDEIKEMLTESEHLDPDNGQLKYKNIGSNICNARDLNSLKNTTLTEDVITNNLSPNGKYLKESVCEIFNVPKEKNTDIAKAIENINEFINEHFVIGNTNHLLEEHINYSNLNEDSSIADFFNNNMQTNSKKGMQINSANNVNKTLNADLTDEEKEKILKSNLDGRNSAVVKRVSAGNIVPLEYENKILGYIYLDIVEYDPDGTVIPSDKSDAGNDNTAFLNSNASGAGNILQNMIYTAKDDSSNKSSEKTSAENPNGVPGISAADDARLEFIAKTFTNQLSAKTNMSLLKKSSSLKTAIYNTLSIKKLNRSEKIRVVYLKPDEVVYINRGQSIFDNILFFSKLYITSLMTILMQNVLRGSPKRITYVEVGLDNNAANSVNQVIRDMKSKDITSVHNMDIQSLLNIASDYQDLYIPVVDGEKPISFDQLEAQEAQSLDNEFLNWLSNNIFSSLLPASFLTEVDNVDFAKSLSMQNSRFLRDIVSDQKILSSGYTELIRRIYYHNYKVNEQKDIDSNIKVDNSDTSTIAADILDFDFENIDIKFPSPSSLNLTNLTDQISNATSVVETIVANLPMDGISEEQKPEFEAEFKSRLMAQYVPTMDWSGIEEIVKDIKHDLVSKSIKKKLVASEKKDDEAASDSSEESSDF